MKNIKNILVPTDFSETARNAFHYAMRFAETLDATITVVHVKEYILPTDEVLLSPTSSIDINRMTDDAMSEFINDREGYQASGSVMVHTKVHTKVLEGNPVRCIVGLSEEDNTDLIIVGSTGAQDIISKIIGKTSLEVANQAQCPVMLIPRDAVWNGIDRMMYASNYDSITPEMILEVNDFAHAIKASIHFVHVDEHVPENIGEVTETEAEVAVPLAGTNQTYEIHTIQGVDKIAGLQQYAGAHKIDLMAFAGKHRSFWHKLIYKSIIANIALSTEIPIMVIHSNDKAYTPPQ
jgi:nucleotide-binding universal stress UspA family protein